MEKDIEFVNGLIVKAPHDRAPDFVKAAISIKVADLGMWLREKHRAGEEWVNVDVKEAKSGKWYAAVSKFEKKEAKPGTKTKGASFDDMDDDIDF